MSNVDFSLERKSRSEVNNNSVALSSDERKKQLLNYIQVPKHYWPEIRMNTYIKYIKEGKITGGMILRNPFLAWNSERNENTHYLKLYFVSNREKNWLVEYNKIDEIYIKRNIITHLMLKDHINKLNSTLKGVAEHIKRLEKEVNELKKKQ